MESLLEIVSYLNSALTGTANQVANVATSVGTGLLEVIKSITLLS